MDDGGVGSGQTLHLNIESLTEEEVNLLLEILNDKFQLKCRKSLKRMNQWRIVFPKSQSKQSCRISNKTYASFNVL